MTISVNGYKYSEFIYEVGKVVVEPQFDKDPWKKCSYGIHFFITKEEALNY